MRKKNRIVRIMSLVLAMPVGATITIASLYNGQVFQAVVAGLVTLEISGWFVFRPNRKSTGTVVERRR